MLSEEIITNVIDRMGLEEIINQIDCMLVEKGTDLFNEKYGLSLDMVSFDGLDEIHLLNYTNEKETEAKSIVTGRIQVDYTAEGFNYFDGEYHLVEKNMDDSIFMTISYFIIEGIEQKFSCLIDS